MKVQLSVQIKMIKPHRIVWHITCNRYEEGGGCVRDHIFMFISLDEKLGFEPISLKGHQASN